MKPYLFTLLIMAVLSMGLKPDANKFAGKWKPLNFYMFPETSRITIENDGGHWLITNSIKPDQPIVLTYYPKKNMMVGMLGNGQVNIFYLPGTDNLKFLPVGNYKPTFFDRDDKKHQY